jgi:aspartyl-tRNA(Asn)/glutamyl-tRNA(Gln) amidotransferase subunit A
MQRQRVCPALPTVYGYEDACALAEAFAEGVADPGECVERCLKAASDHDGVYITYTEARAVFEAELSRMRHARRMSVSSLDGVPVGWKDLFDVAGTVTTAGAALNRNNPPALSDGPLPALAARAGLLCLGKLNTAEFAYSSIGTNPHFGNPVNPYSKPGAPRIPGGSSSASAVAVSAGILPLAVGSDTGGSIRIPAAFNGICGFKPTVGHYDRRGMTFLAPSFDTPGTYARSVRDLVVFDRLLRGRPCLNGIPQPGALSEHSFVIDADMLDDAVIEPAARAMLEAVRQRLEKAGARISIRRIKAFHDAMDTTGQGWISGAETFALLEHIVKDPHKASLMDQRIRKRVELNGRLDPALIARTNMARESLDKELRRELGADVLIVPTVGHGAPLLNDILNSDDVFFKYIRLNVRLTMPGNLLNLPGVSLPAGLDEEDMPLGVTLYRPAGCDKEALRAALAAEEAVVYV